VLVPDLAGWRRERLPKLAETAYFELAPDWVCEIVSQSTGADDRAGKTPIYAREGVKYAWLINPLSRTLEVFHLASAGRMLAATLRGDRTAQVEPFDAIEIDIGPLWTD
jgi:Uma2 family endonuclease